MLKALKIKKRIDVKTLLNPFTHSFVNACHAAVGTCKIHTYTITLCKTFINERVNTTKMYIFIIIHTKWYFSDHEVNPQQKFTTGV
jgi:hypothetical protein